MFKTLSVTSAFILYLPGNRLSSFTLSTSASLRTTNSKDILRQEACYVDCRAYLLTYDYLGTHDRNARRVERYKLLGLPEDAILLQYPMVEVIWRTQNLQIMIWQKSRHEECRDYFLFLNAL